MSSENVPPAEEPNAEVPSQEPEAPKPEPEVPKPEPEPQPETVPEKTESQMKPPETEVKVSESQKIQEPKPPEPAKSAIKATEPQKSVEALKQQESVKRRQSFHGELAASESRKSVHSADKRLSKESSKDLFFRRKSTRSIRNAVGSVISFRRGSIAEYFDRQKTAKFMNTYKLESDKPFNVESVQKIMEEVLIEALENLTYDTDKIPKQAKWASSAIRAKVKEQEYDRYKIVCIVTIGEKRSQDMFSTYRFLWDAERDKHASFVHENMSVFAIALCFGLYYE